MSLWAAARPANQRHRMVTLEDAVRAGNEFVFKDVSFTVKSGDSTMDKLRGKTTEYKHIVRRVSGKVRAGEVFAIVGPSGAGKTTLLNSLTQDAFGGTARGTITLNGTELDSKSFRERCCVVAQQDNHWAFLRCRETIDYAARLYLPDLAPGEHTSRVDDMVARMGLGECAATRVGNQFLRGLSGGQKRRLSLAVALIKNPDVMFLDEPTSGLDAAAALNIMEFVQQLAAKENIIMVCTIHQPSTAIYNSFNNVMVLANGRVAYSGRTETLVPHFVALGFPFPENTNPAEYVLECVNREFTEHEKVDRVLDAWDQDPRSTVDTNPDWQTTVQPPQRKQASVWRETMTLLHRHGKLVFSDPMIYLGRAFMYIIMCSFFAIVYIDMWHVGVPTNLAIIGVYAFNTEYWAIKREVKNGMVRPWPYLLANMVLQIPAIFFLAICGLSISGYAIGAWYGPNYLFMVIIFALVLWSFESVAQLFSVLAANPLMGMLLFMNFWFAAFLFSGILLREDSVVWPFRIFTSILPFKWGIRGMSYLEIGSGDYEGAELCFTANNGSCLYHGDRLPGWKCDWNPATRPCVGATGWQVLDSIGLTFDAVSSEDTVLVDMMIILAIGVVLKILYILVFLFKSTRTSRLHTPSPLEVI